MDRALALVFLLVTSITGEPPAAVTYAPPVAAPVVDGFRPPATPYGAGNRGLEYGVVRGTAVRAAAAGTVTFAGPVAGALHVTVLHADRVRTTYAFLAGIGVAEGDRVTAGQAVGATGDRFLWTARLGRAYLDPAALLAASGHRTVRLVPDRARPGPDGAAPGGGRGPVSAAAARWALEG